MTQNTSLRPQHQVVVLDVIKEIQGLFQIQPPGHPFNAYVFLLCSNELLDVRYGIGALHALHYAIVLENVQEWRFDDSLISHLGCEVLLGRWDFLKASVACRHPQKCKMQQGIEDIPMRAVEVVLAI